MSLSTQTEKHQLLSWKATGKPVTRLIVMMFFFNTVTVSVSYTSFNHALVHAVYQLHDRQYSRCQKRRDDDVIQNITTQ